MTTRTILLITAIGLGGSHVINAFADDQKAPPKTTSWDEVISADTIGDEVASLCEQLEAITSTPQKFAGGGFRQARDHFNELAMLFAIIQQSHEASDWKPAAQPLRQQFSRAASVCKVSTPQVYEVAKAATDNLSSLLKDTYEPPKQAKAAVFWSEIVDRAPLMHRLEECHDELQEKLASKAVFEANREQIKHNTELVAAVATVLRQQTMEDAMDAEYASHTKNLSRHAGVLGRVVDRGDFPAAEVAVRLLIKNCTSCHESYR